MNVQETEQPPAPVRTTALLLRGGQQISLFWNRARPFLRQAGPPVVCAAAVASLLGATGTGTAMTAVIPLEGLPAVLAVCLVSLIPLVSPVVGPGLWIPLAAGILAAEQAAAKAVHPVIILPALFALDAYVGSAFIPRGLSFAEDEPDRLAASVPPVLFFRFITGPLAVLIAALWTFVFFKQG